MACIIGDQTLSYYYDAGTVDQSASDTDTYSDGFESEILLWLDNFNRADESLYDAENWVTVGNLRDEIAVKSNQLKMWSRSVGAVPVRDYSYWDKTYGNDQFSKLIFKSGTLRGWTGLAIGVDTSGEFGDVTMYQAIYDEDTDDVYLYKYENERLIVDGTLLDTYSVTLNDGDSFWLERIGTAIKVKINGSDVISETDSDITGGKVGLSTRAWVGAPNGEAFVIYEDWAGGDIHTLWDREISMYVTYTAGAMATGNFGLTIVGAGR